MWTKNRMGIGLLYRPAWARILKRFWRPEIDSEESISPAYVVDSWAPWKVYKYRLCDGIFKQSMGARNRVGIGLSYHPARLHSTKYVYIKSTAPQSMSPRPNWDSPPNPSLASECAPPPRTGGGGHTRLRASGWGSPNSDDWKKA
jgi:hypothetical protein